MKGRKVKEIMRVCLSDNGKEILMYSENGETLERVYAVRDFAAIAETAREAVESAFQDDYMERNGRHFNNCLGYEDCRAGMCDEHYENEGTY